MKKHDWVLPTSTCVLLSVGTLAFLNSTQALAQDDPNVQLDALLNAFKSGQYAIASGLLLMILVRVLRISGLLQKLKISPKADLWVALGLSLLGSIGASLASGIVWWQGLLFGLVNGFAASGIFETLKKANVVEKG